MVLRGDASSTSEGCGHRHPHRQRNQSKTLQLPLKQALVGFVGQILFLTEWCGSTSFWHLYEGLSHQSPVMPQAAFAAAIDSGDGGLLSIRAHRRGLSKRYETAQHGSRPDYESLMTKDHRKWVAGDSSLNEKL